MSQVIRTLVVDDSALVRRILAEGLSADPEIAVVGKAADPYQARDLIVKLRPDVLTLDVEMPKMDGLEFLKKLMPQYPIPVIMVSALTKKGTQITLDALEAGAVDFVTKPAINVANGLELLMQNLRQKVKMAARVDVSHWKKRQFQKRALRRGQAPPLPESTDKVIAIGASTGGTEALKAVVSEFPANMPGVVIVQHMPPGFTKMFSERLNALSAMDVKEAESGDRIMTGKVLVAPGGKHMSVVRSGGVYRVQCHDGELVCGQKPSVDVLFHSVAKYVGPNAIGVMLTGMGHDGADGMVAMRKAGARTLAQDEATSVVFGMPKEAYNRGGAEKLVPLEKIPRAVLQLLS